MAKFKVTLYKNVEADWIVEADNEDDAINDVMGSSDQPDSDEREGYWEFDNVEELED